MGVTFAMGVSLLSRTALAGEAKATLHPLAFYTMELTSPKNLALLMLQGVCYGGRICDKNNNVGKRSDKL